MERRIHVLNEAGLFIGQLALRMKRDAIYDIMGEELALQDYLSEELREFEFDEDDSVDCLRYTIKVIETLNKADSLDYFAMLRGWEMCRNDALK